MESAGCQRLEFKVLTHAKQTLQESREFCSFERIHSDLVWESPYKYLLQKEIDLEGKSNSIEILEFICELKKAFTEKKEIFLRKYGFGDDTLTVHYCGIGVPEFFHKAISHLNNGNGYVEYNIYVSDEENGGVVLPEPFWSWDRLDSNGFLELGITEYYIIRFQQWTNSFCLVDLQENTAFYWTKDYTKLPEWERSFPFRDILHYFIVNSEHKFIVHSGVLGIHNQGILMPGRGGSGKSTAALACLDSDFKYCGDDLVLVDISKMMLYSLYNTAKVTKEQLELFPQFKEMVYNSELLDTEKAQIFINDFYPEKILLKVPFSVIVLPKYSGMYNSEFNPSKSEEALKALAPSTIGLLKTKANHLKKMNLVSRSAPVYKLHTGRNLSDIPLKIQDILAQL